MRRPGAIRNPSGLEPGCRFRVPWYTIRDCPPKTNTSPLASTTECSLHPTGNIRCENHPIHFFHIFSFSSSSCPFFLSFLFLSFFLPDALHGSCMQQKVTNSTPSTSHPSRVHSEKTPQVIQSEATANTLLMTPAASKTDLSVAHCIPPLFSFPPETTHTSKRHSQSSWTPPFLPLPYID